MHRRCVLVVTRQPELAHKLKNLFSGMDVETHFVSGQVIAALQEAHDLDLDLIVLDGDHEALENLGRIEEMLFEDDAPSLAVVVPEESLPSLRLPVRLPCDFILRSAPDIEYQVRLHQLLWPGEEAGSADFVRVGSLTLNLATYQVKVDGVTLDLTYLEYALLAFLITHPGRTYSRDALLRRVWGFEYYGGSRTVDVHVRRVRAKLGPELAEHLETVRGVGYLWSA
ncbi:MAG: winged helix-turn-helix domain-containing protein [Coriobacteriales bacterium]|jgi:DNA-binding response OmpR family regulator|nr:winged helix-turn-helix domain-containing protein [Coriobacteriales bacterium]